MKTGIFFDLDGTLWDSAQKVVQSWNEIFALENVDIRITEQDMQNVMGKRMEEIADILMGTLPKEERYDILAKCEQHENECIRAEGGTLFAHVEQILCMLSKKYPLFIISNCQKGYIEAFLEHYALEKYITDTENPGVTGLSKGENIQLVAKRNEIDHIIYVGDTMGDYLATKAAGGTFVHAAYGFGTVDEETDKVEDITALPEVLEQIIKRQTEES